VSHDSQPLLRHIPKIDRLLVDPELADLLERFGNPLVTETVRQAVAAVRTALLADGAVPHAEQDLLDVLRNDVRQRLLAGARRTLRRAINATGVVLHTGLGRAVLSDAAAQAVVDTARSHSLLEVDPESGERGSRLAHVSELLRELTGAEDALVVNNNAAAVFLAVAGLASGQEVIISRGQLVEIGGAFRIPDVIRSAGARLVEVGTTNRVRISDYAAAITEPTALLLRVHPSNFRIVGFTEEASLDELTALGRERGIPVVDDLGSGALLDLTRYGLTAEPTVHASVAVGADIITFSGDKLLGGPQAGLVIGKRDYIARLKRHPLMRVLRVDKLTLAALEATLRLYRDEERARREIPTLAALTAPFPEVHERAVRLESMLGALPVEVSLEPGISQVGGGSLPGEELPTTLVCLRPQTGSVTELAVRLRVGEPSVWGRVQRNTLLLDLRTVREEELSELAHSLRLALRAGATTAEERE